MNAPLPVNRQTFLGGSDVAAVLGVAPSTWKDRCTPLDVFLIKTGQRVIEVTDDLQDLFDWGKQLEPVVVNRLRSKHGVRIVKRSTPRKPNRYQDFEYPFLAAEIDFEWRVTKDIVEKYELDPALIGTIQNGEVKTVHALASAKFGDEGDAVPVEYAAQAQHGMMVRGIDRKLCLFGVLQGANRNVDLYFLPRDDKIIATMRKRCVAFWNDHVLAGVPPAAIRIEDVQYLLGHKLPASKTEASAEILALLPELQKARDAKKVAEERETEVKYQIGQYVLGQHQVELRNGGKIVPIGVQPGHHLLTQGGTPVLDVHMQTQNRLDGDRLKAERPEIVAEFSKQTSFLKFAKPPKGKK